MLIHKEAVEAILKEFGREKFHEFINELNVNLAEFWEAVEEKAAEMFPEDFAQG